MVKREIEDSNDNRYAFLAMTSKFELPFRDLLAIHLQNLIPKDTYVTREWKMEVTGHSKKKSKSRTRQSRRVDIAIVDEENNLLCGIEVKATNSQNGNKLNKDKTSLKHVDKHFGSLKEQLNDLTKVKKVDGTLGICGIMIATHPKNRFKNLNEAESSSISSCYTTPEYTPGKMKMYYTKGVENFGWRFRNLERHMIGLGRYLNNDIQLLVHLISNK